MFSLSVPNAYAGDCSCLLVLDVGQRHQFHGVGFAWKDVRGPGGVLQREAVLKKYVVPDSLIPVASLR